MPYVSSIFPKLVSAVTIVMPSSDATRNSMKCDFFSAKQNIAFHLAILGTVHGRSYSGVRSRANDVKVTIMSFTRFFAK